MKGDLLLVWWYATPFGFCPVSEWRKALGKLAREPHPVRTPEEPTV
jgi:hypothetical protein